ncbi:MAG TPA: chemotaxis protein CheW [Halanaerobiales bacterium]|nr:chemotaxis protein CheW [Halanaerobiales bacterium]
MEAYTNMEQDVKNNVTGQYIKFQTGKQAFGIDVLSSREIVREEGITSIPDSPNFVKGVIDLREEIVPIVNLEELFNIKEIKQEVKEKKIIIIKVDGTLIGLEVNKVDEIIEIEKETIKEAPSITKKYNKHYIKGVANHNDQLFIILDVNNIFSEEEIKKIKDVK